MKTKFFQFVAIIFVATINIHSHNAEFLIKFDSTVSDRKFILQMYTTEYAWTEFENEVILLSDYIFTTQENLTFLSFDSPDNINSAPFVMPWGLMKLKIIVTTNAGLALASSDVTIDFRDQRWAEGYGSSIDTYILIDIEQSHYPMFLSKDESINAGDQVLSNQTINIWDFWQKGAPTVQNFKVPITLFNKIENTEISFGYLKADTEEILSGDQGYFRYNTSQSVENGTLEHFVDAIRHYSFKWSNTSNLTVNQNNIYHPVESFTTDRVKEFRSITRYFRPVYPLTIKNSLDELGEISVDNVYFKDPTTTNNYEQKSATGSGFFKDNAFKDLDIEVGDLQNQKYGAKAKSTIDYNGYKFQYSYGDFNTEGSDFLITAPATKVAHYKGIQLTNTSTAYSFNGQTKFLKTEEGHLHNVYESMNTVWYERSTDGGTTWEIMNGGMPLTYNVGGANAKSPAISCSNDGSLPFIYITYQIDNYGGYEEDYVLLSQFFNGVHRWTEFVSDMLPSYSYDTRPVVTGLNQFAMVVYKSAISTPFVATEFKVNTAGNVLQIIPRNFPAAYVNSSCGSPTITNGEGKYHLAYQWGVFSIGYLRWSVYTDPSTFNYYSSPSNGSGYNLNMEPSISLANFNPVISWKGSLYAGSPQAVLRRGTLSGSNMIWSDFLKVGNNINYVHSNSTSNSTEKTVMTWSQDGSTTKWVRRTYPVNGKTEYSSPQGLNPSGINSQVSSGSDYNNMKANIFRSSTPLYYFTQSTTDFSVLQEQGGELNKITVDDTIVTFGRSGVAEINGVEFVFNIGDVLAGDSIIQFIDKPDTIVYASSNELNEFTRTNNFALDPGTNFYFTNIYYVVQKSDPDTALSTNDAVNFKVELVYAITDQVVGAFDNITYNKTNLEKYASIDYEVDCSGITAGEYYLRLVTSVNGDANYALANIISDNTTLAKKNFNKVNFTGSEIPITYELSNNFPNPFNPSTTIRYQIPQDGIVTLKIYDILGSEVATLVNEEKVAGKYEVNFNASALASGVYIYKIQAGSFINSKKMILLK